MRRTKKLYLIGKTLKHSLSKYIHNTILRKMNLDVIYENLEVPLLDNLENTVNLIKDDEDCIGFNITIPYKEEILRFCDEMSEDVKVIGAANTVKKIGNALVAYNTDWIGLIKSWNDIKANFSGKKILILGAGGAAKACVYALYSLGVKEVFVSNRTQIRVDEMKKSLSESGLKIEIIFVDWLKRMSQYYDIVINTTPLGMYPDNSNPFDFKLYSFDGTYFAYDVVYNPAVTPFLKSAQEIGIKCNNGLRMLIWQAIEAQKIWFGSIISDVEKDYLEIEKICNEVLYKWQYE